ncbi:MAG: hypothetical protein IJT46_07465 [Bacteroidaceae bacterium]|nr:hypothetical protein [Bacteroidaceae bacterium]
MMALLVYSIKSALVLTLLYLPYTLMLRQESFFRMNRITLLTILMLALVLPMVDIPSLATPAQPVVYEMQQRIMLMTQEAESQWGQDTLCHGMSQSILTPMCLLALVYIIGICLALCIRLWQLFRIGQIIRGGCLWTDKSGEATIYCHIDDVAPFSWMRSIVISESDYKPFGCEILLHEKAHILNRHSIDILFLTLVEAVQWWNPIAYLLGRSLRDVHEYEADDYVLHQGISLHNYQALLVKKALANTSYAFANNFNHSLIKKRIYMMNHPKSNPWLRSKVLYILPVTLVVLTAFATPKLNKKVEKVVEEVKHKDLPSLNPLPKAITMKDVVFVNEGKKITLKEFQVLLKKRHEVYVGNMENLRECLDRLGIKDAAPIQDKALEILTKEYGKDVLERMIWIQIFNEDKRPRIIKFGDYIVDDNILTLQNARVEYDDTALVNNVYRAEYHDLTQDPEFPGGTSALRAFVQQHVAQALENDASVAGKRAYVQFRIKQDGTIDDIGLVRGDRDAYREAVKIVEQMPQWIPARRFGELADTHFVLTIDFNND